MRQPVSLNTTLCYQHGLQGYIALKMNGKCRNGVAFLAKTRPTLPLIGCLRWLGLGKRSKTA